MDRFFMLNETISAFLIMAEGFGCFLRCGVQNNAKAFWAAF
jgi:hypothetical protein